MTVPSFFKFTVHGKNLDAFVRVPGESVQAMRRQGLVQVSTDFPRIEIWVRASDLSNAREQMPSDRQESHVYGT